MYPEVVQEKPRGRLVYNTERGRACPRCGWPERDCCCAAALDQPVPGRIVAHLRIEKAGRGGKTVTVVDNLPRNAAFLAELAADLKKRCGTGGTVRDTGVEIQGDHRARLRQALAARGWAVKG